MEVAVFQEYTDRLRKLFGDSLAASISVSPSTNARITAALDGEASQELRRLVSLEWRRKHGAFFTRSGLAEKALGRISHTIGENSVLCDPACGAGDLLIAASRHLPIHKDLNHTLRSWSRQIRGRDLHRPFIDAAKVRLGLLALQRLGTGNCDMSFGIDEFFPDVSSGSSLDDPSLLRGASHLLLNPPFTLMLAPADCTWSSGMVNSAAVFLETALLEIPEGCRVVAILPDVLRSGTRYAKWRRRLAELAMVHAAESCGRFDNSADVDVFILDATAKRTRAPDQTVSWSLPTEKTSATRLGDIAEVTVGPVVQYRDPCKGRWFPFIQAKSLPMWESVTPGETNRRFLGRTLLPPFVVVRRTSSPDDRYRAVASVVLGDRPVAVENHLLVIQPTTRTVLTCKCIAEVLRSPETNQWLNSRIRCRHLTVEALRELPLPEGVLR